MLEKHKKLILSQICAVMGLAAVVLGFLRYQQTESLTEQMTLSFFLFAIVLFAIEIRLVLGWLRERKDTKS
jgi:hypothetical protein